MIAKASGGGNTQSGRVTEEQWIEKHVKKLWKQMNVSCHLVVFVASVSSVCGRDVTSCGRGGEGGNRWWRSGMGIVCISCTSRAAALLPSS